MKVEEEEGKRDKTTFAEVKAEAQRITNEAEQNDDDAVSGYYYYLSFTLSIYLSVSFYINARTNTTK